MELRFQSLLIQKLNIPVDRLQKVDKKWGLFVLLSCLLQDLKSFKCQNGSFSSDDRKNSITVWVKD